MTFHLRSPIFIQKLQYGRSQLLCIGLVGWLWKVLLFSVLNCLIHKVGEGYWTCGFAMVLLVRYKPQFPPTLKGKGLHIQESPPACVYHRFMNLIFFFSKNQLLVSFILLYFFHFIDFFWFLLFNLPTLDYFNFLP